MKAIGYRAYIKSLKLIANVVAIDFSTETLTVDLSFDTEHSADYEYDFSEVKMLHFTGLQDKYGVLVYEDDVLMGDDGRVFYTRVSYDKDKAKFMRGEDIELWEKINELEVVGNIHTHSHLQDSIYFS